MRNVNISYYFNKTIVFSCFLLLALNVNAGAIKFPNYVNNYNCLKDGNPADCLVYEWYRSPEEWDQHVPTQLQLSNGELRVYLSYTSQYTQMMQDTTIGMGWKPIYGSDKQLHYRYKYRLQGGNGDHDYAFVTAKLLVAKASDLQGTVKWVDCTGKMRLDSRVYSNDVTHEKLDKLISCSIPLGYYPQTVRLSFPSLRGTLRVNQLGASDRSLYMPEISAGIWVSGCQLAANDSNKCVVWKADRLDQAAILSYRTHIRLNDRICKFEIDDKVVDFSKDISASAPGKKKIQEVAMPMNIKCLGSEPDRSGSGIPKDVVSVSIQSTSGHLPGQNEKTIGLTTDNVVRNDLYVEGSLSDGLDCGVEALYTNGTPNKFNPLIRLPGNPQNNLADPRDTEVVPKEKSTIYWKLCTPEPFKGLKPGDFRGSANISVEFQ